VISFSYSYHRDHDDGIIMMDRASNGHVKGENKYILSNQLHLPVTQLCSPRLLIFWKKLRCRMVPVG
jgi:hypothetical protein